ncbi:hypothetical protein [Nicoliella lavandulae]|uniref:Uncharacterized protein n=1 Tax=Nicoliella lavandulae TaxID=3082954 RepID=A0ABU8SJL2_9LACO
MDNTIIYDYFKLPSKIEHARKRYTYYDWLFWQQSFMSCPNAYDDNGNKIGFIPFQKQVDNLLSYEDLNDNVVDMLNFKWQEFNRYLDDLTGNEHDYLRTKFMLHTVSSSNAGLEQSTINECNQIEEASGYRYGFINDKAVDLTNDFETNFDNILSVLE